MNSDSDQEFKYHADVSAQRVARVYAEALLNAAESRHEAEAVHEQLQSVVHDLFRAEPLFETFLASGIIDRKRKEEVIRSLFDNRASEVFVNFLLVLNKHERLDLLRPILAAFRDLRDQRAGRMRVLVRSAVALPDDQRDRLQQTLRETFQWEPILETRVEPDLLGGVVVRVGDWVYDTSVRSQLENLRKELIERSSYEIQSGRNRFSVG